MQAPHIGGSFASGGDAIYAFVIAGLDPAIHGSPDQVRA